MDSQKEAFMKQVIEKESAALGVNQMEVSQGLTPYQKSVLEKIRSINAEPITTKPSGSSRTPEQVAASTDIHKRVNPGYVEMPYRSTNTMAFNYVPPPDFTRQYLKKDSDCKFQKYAAEAILKHVDLK